MLSRLVITFLPRSKCLLISWLQSPSAVILEPKKWSLTLFPLFPHLFAMKWWDPMPWSSFSECWALSQLFHSPLSFSSRGFLVPFCHKGGVICMRLSQHIESYAQMLICFFPNILPPSSHGGSTSVQVLLIAGLYRFQGFSTAFLCGPRRLQRRWGSTPCLSLSKSGSNQATGWDYYLGTAGMNSVSTKIPVLVIASPSPLLHHSQITSGWAPEDSTIIPKGWDQSRGSNKNKKTHDAGRRWLVVPLGSLSPLEEQRLKETSPGTMPAWKMWSTCTCFSCLLMYSVFISVVWGLLRPYHCVLGFSWW